MFSGLCLSISCTFFQGYLRIQKAKQKSQTEVKQIFLSRTLLLAYTLEQIFSASFHHLTLISGRSHPIYTNLYQQSCQLVTITDVPDHSIFWNNQKVLKQKRNRLCAIYKMKKHRWNMIVINEPKLWYLNLLRGMDTHVVEVKLSKTILATIICKGLHLKDKNYPV